MTRTLPIIGIAIIWALTPNAWSLPSSSVTATATATVVEALIVTGKTPLNFGFIAPSQQGGSVTISPDNKRSETGSVEASSSFARAEFTVRGTPNRSYGIQVPSSLTFSAKEEGNNNGNKSLIRNLTVKNFVTYSVTAAEITSTGKLDSTGRDRIYLGATLIAPADAAPGVYSGLVPLTVSY